MNNDHIKQTGLSETAGHTVAEIQDWIVRQLSDELHVSLDKIKLDQPIMSCGIDSVQVVSLMSHLEDWRGFRFSENPLEEYPTIERLSQFVADLTSTKSLDKKK